MIHMNISIDLAQLLTGAILAGLVGLAAYLGKMLTPGGAAAAAILGTVVFGLGGGSWAVILLMFFISSSLLSFLLKKRKSAAESNYAKGSTRDAGQVLANGGLGGLAVFMQLFFPQSPLPWLLFGAAFAAANADTWATELGVLDPSLPRLITTGKRVERGTSGGVSRVGTLAALTGAAFISLGMLLVSPAGMTAPSIHEKLVWALIVLVSGFTGSLVDSILGATLQAMYYCPTCRKETEKYPLHTCGTPTRFIRGWQWMNNDWVNLFCTLSACLAGVILKILILP